MADRHDVSSVACLRRLVADWGVIDARGVPERCSVPAHVVEAARGVRGKRIQPACGVIAARGVPERCSVPARVVDVARGLTGIGIKRF
jgi:hypothetical protein